MFNVYSPDNLLERSLTSVEKFKIVFFFFLLWNFCLLFSSKNNIDIADPCDCCSLSCFVSLFIYALWSCLSGLPSVAILMTEIMPIALPLLKLQAATRMSFHDERFQ
jgi:hypothetical protein